jgi:hypothetical protein
MKKEEKFSELLDSYLTAREDWLLATRSRGTSWDFEREMEKRLEKASRKLDLTFKAKTNSKQVKD